MESHGKDDLAVGARTGRISVGHTKAISGPAPCVQPPFGSDSYSSRRLSVGHEVSDPWLTSIDKLLPKDGRYWYLAGPMSGLPGHNYPEFNRITQILRNQEYPIVSPAEFEHESHRARIAEGDGTDESAGVAWTDCLARDVAVVANPRCIGVILIDGWHGSKGALLETQVATSLGKPLFEFSEDPLCLKQVDRDEALSAYDKTALLDHIEGAIKRVQEQVGKKPIEGGFLGEPPHWFDR